MISENDNLEQHCYLSKSVALTLQVIILYKRPHEARKSTQARIFSNFLECHHKLMAYATNKLKRTRKMFSGYPTCQT